MLSGVTPKSPSGKPSRGPRRTQRLPHRRPRAQLLPRRAKTLSHPARRQHLHPQARGLGRRTALRARLPRRPTHRRRHLLARLRRAHAQSARGNPKRAMEDLRAGGTRRTLPRRERKLHPRPACLSWSAIANCIPTSTSAVRRTFSRDIPSELLNHRLDLGVVSFVPAGAATRRHQNLPRRTRLCRLAAPPLRQTWPRGHGRPRRGSPSSRTSSNRPSAIASCNSSPSTTSR